jgi:sulfoxide reductase heme-binding subunit YedZ
MTRAPATSASWKAALPWTDRAGRLSWLKLVVFLATLAPAGALAWAAANGELGPKAVMTAVHEAGDWAIRFLVATLAVTPLRRILAAPRIGTVRRMLGLAALAYALLHLMLYAVELNYDLLRVAGEIASRVYLMIGFAALLGLAVLGATSTDAAIARLGRNWGRLHAIVYAIAVLGVVHYFLQSKANVTQAVLVGGLFLLLMAYRAGFAGGLPMPRPWVLALFAGFGGLMTAGIEYAWYALATGVRADRVLAANLRFPDLIRPAWWVFFAGLCVALLPVLARLWERVARITRKPRPRRVRAAATAE